MKVIFCPTMKNSGLFIIVTSFKFNNYDFEMFDVACEKYTSNPENIFLTSSFFNNPINKLLKVRFSKYIKDFFKTKRLN